MKNEFVFRWTGFFGIVLYLLVLIEIPLYFVYTPTAAGTPPLNIILWRILVDMGVCMSLICFFSGFKNVVSQLTPEYGWLGTFIFANGLAFAVVALVADSIQAGGAWSVVANPDPTAVGKGAEGALLIYGPINRILTATILLAGSSWIAKTSALPRWIGWMGYAACLYNLAFVPTLFYMTTPLDFYSTNGWNIPIAAGFFFLWLMIIGIVLIRKANTTVVAASVGRS